jgi:DNA helicase-2/ATP-dependent DNA helicase PcrA
VGEKPEMTSKVYLSPFGVTRAEEELYITNAQMRTLFGRTSMNPPSRFIREIPEDLLDGMEPVRKNSPFGGSVFGSSPARPTPRKPVIRPAMNATGGDEIGWKVGDKAEHGKWGTGTVVSVKGEGEGIELDIAFPKPVGIKRLLAKFAPITKA